MKNIITNFSEIAPLKKVLMHRPGEEFLNLTPNTLERLLFDDIPYLKQAQAEHDAFANALRAEGVTRGCKGLKGAARMVVRKAGGRGWTGAGPGGTRSQGMPKPKTAEAAYCRSRPLVPDLALSLAGTR